MPKLIVALAVVVATPAHAHLVETGFGAFYDGIAHVAVTPSDLLVVVALALLAGQGGTRAARYAVFALPVAWLVGGLIGARWPSAATLPLLTTLSFAIAGALVDHDMLASIIPIAVTVEVQPGIDSPRRVTTRLNRDSDLTIR